MSDVDGFLPSTKAPLFGNGPWPVAANYEIQVLGLPPVTIDSTAFGFCGGMAFLAKDIFEAGTPQLRGTDSQAVPVSVVHHILSRLIDSFDGPGVVGDWLVATSELDHRTIFGGDGLFAQTVDEASKVMATIDAGTLCPIGVVLVQSAAPWAVFHNHVELVYGYDLADSQLTLHVYDCNYPGRDDITISLDIGSRIPAKAIETNGTDGSFYGSQPGRIRGFFVLPYSPADPSPLYVDDGAVSIQTPPPPLMSPSQSATVILSATNYGTTSWDPGAGYRLGSQDPQDNTEWGTGRIKIPTVIDPGATAVLNFDITAPSSSGNIGFEWQMVRESVHWFGTPSTAIAVPVGIESPQCSALEAQYAGLASQLDDLQQEISLIDWADPITARQTALAISRKIDAIQPLVASIEKSMASLGCLPPTFKGKATAPLTKTSQP
ncbi:hypothetical protein [Arthrobacter bambusae]|uniref:Next to BRCA1 central domain-containing protein n=1 Tax=Arthrobacter bambusae TaxID=1338426 RepID=A0AAW8D322_9MICC|nr:hypothetical protein [Arthrobacter bambusae]MDP9903296.1 hypothetical protein [Arthrobacter bambusae]MDQ0128710.1 hypothetical protein [Arthrobacter bambusae]MDQ0180051.1 hypothetical protein [Arthrobacter bambusae]